MLSLCISAAYGTYTRIFEVSNTHLALKCELLMLLDELSRLIFVFADLMQREQPFLSWTFNPIQKPGKGRIKGTSQQSWKCWPVQVTATESCGFPKEAPPTYSPLQHALPAFDTSLRSQHSVWIIQLPFEATRRDAARSNPYRDGAKSEEDWCPPQFHRSSSSSPLLQRCSERSRISLNRQLVAFLKVFALQLLLCRLG